MKLPIYDIAINLEDEETGMTAISLVDYPAVEIDYMAFSKDETKKQINFAVQDTMEHKITGVAIRADYPIYRCDPDGYEYYVRFGKHTIQDLVLKYSKQGLTNMVDLQHDGQMIGGVTMIEYYIKDTEKGISPKGFEDVEDGSLFCTYKVEDEALWNEIIAEDSQFNGFSIEVFADLQPTHEYVEEPNEEDYVMDPELEALLNWLCGLDDTEVVFESEKKKFSVDRSTVASAIDKKRMVKIYEGGDEAVDYYIHSLGKKNGKNIMVLYQPDEKEWSEVYLEDVKEMIVTNQPISDFDYSSPSYQAIIDDEEVTVQRTQNTGSFSDLIHNRIPCMISYNDEKERPHTGYRQCAVIAVGFTKLGNECIRVMQEYGDSRSMVEGEGLIPDYRMMLTKRIVSIKPMQNVQPWGRDILDSRVNMYGDKGMETCTDHIKEEDFND